jgi:hypothetical protein
MTDRRDCDQEELVRHLLTMLSVSAGMVGVCLTAIGIIRVSSVLSQLRTIGDDVVALDALLFLVASLLSFLALRSPLKRRRQHIVLAIDVLFCAALVVMVIVCGLLVWGII